MAERLACLCPQCGATLPILRDFATAKTFVGRALMKNATCRRCASRVRVAGNYFAQNARQSVFVLPFLLLAFAVDALFGSFVASAAIFVATFPVVFLLSVRLNGLEVIS